MSFREILLGDAIHVKHGFAFKSQYFASDGEYIVLTPGNFHEEGGFRLRPEKDRFYIGDIPEEYVLNENDLIIAMTEQGPGLLGSSALIPKSGLYLHNQRLGLIQNLNKRLLDKIFLYYLFNTRHVRGQISGSASGTKVRHTAPERIYRVKVTVPSEVSVQKKIGAILSAYDDLIENNRRRIQLLEQSARLLYKEWFVYLRFPGHEHVKVVDGVPEGWEKTFLPEVIDVNPKTPIEKDKEVFYVPMSALSETDMTANIDVFERRTKHTNVKFRKNDVLLARITPCLENGKTGFAYFLNDNEVACGSTEFIILRGSRVSPEFTYCLARSYDLRGIAIRSMIGSSGRQRVQVSCFDEYRVPLPPNHLLAMFDEIVKPNFEQIKVLMTKNERLIQARNLLLPRLMNGEIVV